MQKDKDLSPGVRLKRLRLEKNLTLEQVHKKTKIPLNILEAIEEDRLLNVDPVYIRGFLKIYGNLLGVDHREFIPSHKPGVPQEQIQKEKVLFSDSKPKVSFFDGSTIKLKIIISVLVFLVLIFAIFKLAHIKRTHAAKLSRGTTEAEKSFSVVPATTLKLGIRAKEDCWIKASVDGKVVFQNILKKGRFETWQANEKIELSLGNAGGIELEVNGKPFSPLGRRGQVLKRILITKEGLQVLK